MCNFQNDDTLGKLSSAPLKICIGKISDTTPKAHPYQKLFLKTREFWLLIWIFISKLFSHSQLRLGLSLH
jgi:hypothetical protein